MKNTACTTVTIATLSALLFMTPHARADEACDFNNLILQLRNDLQEEDGSPVSFQDELTVKRNVLSAVTDCAIKEIDGFSQEISRITTPGATAERIKTDLLLSAEEGKRYYQLRKDEIPYLGTEGIRYFSRNLIEWRQANIVTLRQRIDVFTLWSENQPIFQKAKERFEWMRNFLAPLPPQEYTAVRALLSEAEANLFQAEEANRLVARDLERRSSLEALPPLYESLRFLSLAYTNLLGLGDAFKK